MSNFTNSPLAVLTRLSPNRNSPRNQPITKITIHHTAGNIGLEALGDWLSRPTTQASYNYGISTDGRIGLFVEERNRSWASSSGANDHQAITIGVANNRGAPDWSVSDAAFASLLELCVCICRRNGIVELVYNGTPAGSLTRHNFFSATNCPAPFLQSRFPEIMRRVNEMLAPASTPANIPSQTITPPAAGALYNLHVPLSGFTTAADALANRNPRNTQEAGEYFVFNTSGQAVNITNVKGRAGSWINGALNVSPVPATPTPPTSPENAALTGVADWAADAWLWAMEALQMDGTRPTAQITRQEVMTLLHRLFNLLNR
ncbi:MAG: N-acetylmuramoyl-L-alanine amidase [Oscillospiraceae bacterium]|nr:N-acetylmuramoyl-L-alanine amidase [Oscillospiraceae bacterium]